jgi:hypothetical protein
MHEEIRHFKRMRSEGRWNGFDEELLPDSSRPGHENFLSKSHCHQGEFIEVAKPLVCNTLVKQLSRFFSGRQQHICLTLTHIDRHTDRRDEGMTDSVLLIPLQSSPLHFLQVDDERRQLLAGKAYAFNSYREHALIYDAHAGAHAGTKPFCALKVIFDKADQKRSASLKVD